jgi:hypothetical protein
MVLHRFFITHNCSNVEAQILFRDKLQRVECDKLKNRCFPKLTITICNLLTRNNSSNEWKSTHFIKVVPFKGGNGSSMLRFLDLGTRTSSSLRVSGSGRFPCLTCARMKSSAVLATARRSFSSFRILFTSSATFVQLKIDKISIIHFTKVQRHFRIQWMFGNEHTFLVN